MIYAILYDSIWLFDHVEGIHNILNDHIKNVVIIVVS